MTNVLLMFNFTKKNKTMPFQTQSAIVGGNLNNEIRQKIIFFLTLLDIEIKEQTKSKNINPKFVKILQPINYVIVATTNEIHIVISNQNLGGIVNIQFIDLQHKALNLQTAIYIIERDYMYSNPFGISFPNFYLDLSGIEIEMKAKEIIEKYIEKEVLIIEKIFDFYFLNFLSKQKTHSRETLKFFKV